MTDWELVMRILADPSDEDAAYFLIHNRYRPLVCKCCFKIFNNLEWLKDCEHELFIYLRGSENNWHRLRGIQNSEAIAGWMSQTIFRRIKDIKPRLIGGTRNISSIDDQTNGISPVQIPDNGVEEYERREKMLQILEAIPRLKNKDQKMVVIKTLKGYHSKEIAEMLDQKWKAEGYVKIDKGKVVTPTPSYIDGLRQKAVKQLKKIITNEQNNY